MMRNAEADLMICESATPPPWETGSAMWANANIYSRVLKKRLFIPEYKTWEELEQAGRDAEFVSLAREALPWWINRAQKLEVENERLRKALEDSLNILPSCTADCKKPLRKALEGGGE